MWVLSGEVEGANSLAHAAILESITPELVHAQSHRHLHFICA